MNIKERGRVRIMAALAIAVVAMASAVEPNDMPSSDSQSGIGSSTGSGALLLADERGTSSAPIPITATNPADAVRAQMGVLKQMASERGVAWRVHDQIPVGPVRARTIQTILDVVGVVEQEIVTQRESVYFRFIGLPGVYSLSALPTAMGFVDPRSGLRLPYQLGWLHLGKSEDNERSDPGYGWSVYYGAAGIKATVYVYDLGQHLGSDEIAQKRVQDEFDSVLEQITMVHQGAKLGDRTSMRDESGRERWLLAPVVMPDESLSAVALTARGGFFIKVRITWEPNETVDEMAKESLAAIMDAVH